MARRLCGALITLASFTRAAWLAEAHASGGSARCRC